MRELDLYSGLPPQEPVPPEPEGPGETPVLPSTGDRLRRGSSSAGRTGPEAGAERAEDWIQDLWRGFLPGVRERFTPRAVIGEGGMGVVIEAFDRLMDRTVAIKGPRDPAGLSDNSRARQLLEAQIAARLAHPNILPVFDLWSDARGNPWCSMLRVPGANPTLAAYLATLEGLPLDKRPLVQILRTFLEICRAVQFAHSAGYLHRDLKPENVFIGEAGEALVADWGVATRTDAVRGGTRDRVGTRGYAAPEQLGMTGDTRADERSDIYSLGVLLYEMLVGRRYARVSSASTGGYPAAGEPPPEGPPIPDLVPRELRAIIERATAWDPRARQADVRQLVREIDAFQTGELLDGFEYGVRERWSKYAVKHPLRAGVALTGLIAGVVLLAMTIGLRNQHKLLCKRLAMVFSEKAAAARDRHDTDLALHYSAMALHTWPQQYVMPVPTPYTTLAEGLGRGRHLWSQQLSAVSTCVAFSPDGRTVAVADGAGGVELWDWTKGARTAVRVPQSSAKPVLALSFARSGRLAAAAQDGAIHVWEPDGRALADLRGHEGPVRSMAIGPDGQLVASAGDDGFLRLFGLDGYRPPVDKIRAPTMGPGSLALDRPLEKVFLTAADGSLAMMDIGVRTAQEFPPELSDKRLIGHIKPVAGGLRHLSYIPHKGPNGEILVAFSARSPDQCNQVQLWDLTYWRDVGVLHHDRRVTATCFAPASRNAAGEPVGNHALCVASEDGVIRVWDVLKRAVKVELTGGEAPILAIAVSPDGRLLASVDAEGALRVWDIQVGWLRLGMPRPRRTPADILFTPDRKHVIEIERATGIATAFDALTRTAAGASKALVPPVLAPAAMSRDARRVLLRHADRVTTYDLRVTDGQPVLTRASSVPATDRVRAVAFSTGGRPLVLERSAAGFALKDGDRVVSEVLWPHPEPAAVVLAPDGTRALFALANGQLRLWQPSRTGRDAELCAEYRDVTAVGLSEDGERAALGHRDGLITLWVRGKSRHVELAGHLSPVREVAFAPGGHALASIADEPVIRLWDTAAFADVHEALRRVERSSPYEYAPDEMSLVSRRKFRPQPWFPPGYTPQEAPR